LVSSFAWRQGGLSGSFVIKHETSPLPLLDCIRDSEKLKSQSLTHRLLRVGIKDFTQTSVIAKAWDVTPRQARRLMAQAGISQNQSTIQK
jgi:hypothetical protein